MADSSQTAGTMDTQNFQDDVHAEQTRWVNFYWNRQLCCICQQSKTYAIQPGEAGGTGKFLTRRRSCEVRKQPGPPALPGWIAVLTCVSAVLCLACTGHAGKEQSNARLRGAWRDYCIPEPFSWFLHETGLESVKITCTLFFIEISKERLEKSERTPTVSWRPWTLAYSRDRPYNFSCLSTVSKNRHFRRFFLALGCHLARKSLLWPAMSVSNKKQEFEQRKRIKLFDDFWVRAYRFDPVPRRRPRAQSM